MEDVGRLVARGYDQMAERYPDAALRSRSSDTYYRGFLDRCLALARSRGGLALDLGCGAGIVTAEIAAHAHVVGVDLSATQLRLARARAPEAAFVQADMTRLEFVARSFDAVAAFWSVIHVPRERHAELFNRVHAWLCPGGVLFGTFGSGDNPDDRADFYGAPMYWSHFDAATNRRLLREAGFRLLEADVVEDRGESFLWAIATV